MISRSSRCMVSKPITCCSVMRWASTPRGMECPQHKKTEGAFRPLERGSHREGAGVCVRTTQRRRLPQVTTAPGALWHYEVLHGRLGSLRAAYRPRAASRRQGEHTENREQAHQSPDPGEAARASHAVLFQDGTDARSGDWAIHQSV